MKSRHYLAFLLSQICTLPAFGQIQLAADDAPSDPPWKRPATLSYVRNGDGTSSTTADAVVRYKFARTTASPGGAAKSDFSVGAYLHRDKDSSEPTNDRGVSIGYGQLIVRDADNSGPVRSINWSAKATFGKTLEKYEDAAGTTVRTDRTKDRQLLRLSGYYQPAIAGVPVSPDSRAKPPLVMFFDGTVGGYSDHSSGGSGSGTGRLTGVLAEVSANFAPFGLDPSAGFNRIGGLGVVPTLRLAAQVQRDVAASGTRAKDKYKLYTIEASLAFAKLSGNGFVPSLNISRTLGADLLSGRPDTRKTEISFGVTF